MRHHLTTLLLALLTAVCAGAQNLTKLHDCDLLFHKAPSTNAITDATSHDGLPLDHVGIFCHLDGKAVVVEATYRGVVITPIERWMKHPERIVVGRVRGSIDKQRTIANALSHVGKPYDYLFAVGDDEVYCTELVQLSYVDKHGRAIFDSVPMSFHDATGKILPYWEDYFSRRGTTLPEGKPGTNPSQMAHHKRVKLKK